jgi:two-component system response regulator DegU
MNQATPIKVLCVDDSPDIVELLQVAINREAGMRSVGTLTDTDELASRLVEMNPDVVLLDLTMPGRNVIELIREARDSCPDVRFIIFSGRSDQDLIDQAMGAGAWGYICKDRELSELVRAIREVAAGKIILTR